MAAEGGGSTLLKWSKKSKGSRSLISRARSRSVDSHQGASEPTLVPTSFARRNRSPRVDSRKEASAWQSRHPSRSGTTQPAVDICDEASGASGITNLGPHFTVRKGGTKIVFRCRGLSRRSLRQPSPQACRQVSNFRVRYAAQPISPTLRSIPLKGFTIHDPE